MANFILTPNMALPVPTVGIDGGPDYAFNINNSLTTIDSHDHSPGFGVQITPSGLSISSDLTIQSNNLTSVASIGFAGLTLDSVLFPSIYAKTGDLFFRDGSGVVVRITQGGSVTGASGTITGLPSGTASASYSGGTFVFQSATNTAAFLDASSLIIRNTTASSFGLTLQAPVLSNNYSLTLPTIPLASNSPLLIDTSGNITPGTPTSFFLPPGMMAPFGGTAAPSGWFFCDGTPVSRTVYANLFGTIGTTFGVGDGTTTFNLPNMSGNVAIGPGGTIGAALGGTGGEATHVLTTPELPSHAHQETAFASVNAQIGSSTSFFGLAGGGAVGPGGPVNETTLTTGSDAAHNNVQPYLALNWIIKQ